MSDYVDYKFHFPTTDLQKVLGVVIALRKAGLLKVDELPSNMLGNDIIVDGVVVLRGSVGVGSSTYKDTFTDYLVTIPARGDPAMTYVNIRTATEIPASFDPSIFGLIPTDDQTSRDVLGDWA